MTSEETLLPIENNDTEVQSYAEARQQGRALQRRNVVEVASILLKAEGPAAITVRRLAQELDCSTKVIYTMFGSKDGLANELYLRGFEQMQRAFAAVPSGASSEAYLTAVSSAYWEFAMTNPHLYAVMFSQAIPDFTPDETAQKATETVLSDIIEVVKAHELVPTENAMHFAKAFWALMHGGVSLKFAGHLADDVYARSLFDFSIHMMLTGMFQLKRNT